MQEGGRFVVPEGITHIDRSAFYKRSDLKGTLSLPSTLVEVGAYAFQFCDGLSGPLRIPDSVVKIGSQAFYDCKFSDISVKRGTTLVKDSSGDGPFWGCSASPGKGEPTTWR